MTTGNGAPSTNAPETAAADGQGSLIGQQFGNYRVERRLASGGMGEVFLLRHTTLEDKYRVVKTILPEFSARADIRDRFDREARAVAQLGDHPQIVGIDDYGMMEDGRLWMMMPFVHGQPLDEYLRAQGWILPPYRVLELLIDVALALDHAHGLGIIHRDIKPSNVFVSLLGGTPTCKLLDFGIARQRGNNAASQTHSALGTPSYMAAEQYEHAAEADVTADIYALACMAWEMESSTPPWPDADMAVLYHQKLNVPPPPPRAGAMSPEREAFLRTCVAPNPALRPQSVRSFITGYAATIPSASRFVPSGTQLLERRGSKLTERASTETTVRRPSDATTPSAPLFPGLPEHSAMPRTTLGAASVAVGATATSSAPRPWTVISIGAIAAIIAGFGVYAVASQRGRTSTAVETSRPATSGPKSPSATPTSEGPPPPPASSVAPKLSPPIPAASTTTAVRSEAPVAPPAPSSSTPAAPATTAHTTTTAAPASTTAAPAPASITPSTAGSKVPLTPKRSPSPHPTAKQPAPPVPVEEKFNPNARAGE